MRLPSLIETNTPNRKLLAVTQVWRSLRYPGAPSRPQAPRRPQASPGAPRRPQASPGVPRHPQAIPDAPRSPNATKMGAKRLPKRDQKQCFSRFGWKNGKCDENILYTTLWPHRPPQKMTMSKYFWGLEMRLKPRGDQKEQK